MHRPLTFQRNAASVSSRERIREAAKALFAKEGYETTTAAICRLAGTSQSQIIKHFTDKQGITHVTWHLLRHWHTTVLHDEGIPIKVAQEWLGHSRAETTIKHYVHLSQQAEAEAAEAVSRRLRAARKTRKSRSFVSTIVSRREAVCA